MVYHNNFENWIDVQRAYEMDEPEPEVLYADYSYGDYTGSSIVLYRIDDIYYVNVGGHCSCHGLEGQWNPEEYDLDTLKKCLDKYDYKDGFADLKDIVSAL